MSCVCEYGYSGPGNTQCEPCPPGTYKDTRSMAACTACPTDTYQPNTVATNISECLRCPLHSVSQPSTGSIGGCLCIPGYYREGDACSACPKGFYTDQYNLAACIECGPNHMDGGRLSCDACPMGQYKAGPGNYSCTTCPENTYADALASTGCSSCPLNSISTSGSSSECDACPPGKFKARDGSTEACQDCPTGYFQPLSGQAQCLPCSAVGLYTTTVGPGTASPSE
ncbi:hypothetical protein GUITHDRAFT_83387, partial [Guillardia theta CCMP2712]